jgi:hypothetical protein
MQKDSNQLKLVALNWPVLVVHALNTRLVSLGQLDSKITFNCLSHAVFSFLFTAASRQTLSPFAAVSTAGGTEYAILLGMLVDA